MRWATAGLILLAWSVAFGQGCPTVAVVIPETVIIREIPRPVPDPAAETAIIKHFLDYGFNVVDLVHVPVQRATPEGLKLTRERALAAMAGAQTAIRELAGRDGAAVDVLVVGEAVSTVTVFEALRIPGQPRLQDGRARVEVRAIRVATGQILAAEALHTGGLDFAEELAGKKSLERAGDKVACKLAAAIAQRYPFTDRCFKGCTPPAPTIGAVAFENRSGCFWRGLDIGQVFATAVETALSERGCKTAQAMASEYVVAGVISDCRVITTPTIDLPILNLLLRGVMIWVSVDVRLLDVSTAEFQGFEVEASVSGIEIFGIRFGASPRDLARAVAREIAARVGLRCRR
ncbi:MAG: hypothetical protein ABDI20_03235 [Candidatus Bipolaricaulaceae bacterium]